MVSKDTPFHVVAVATYGGMFFHKSLLAKIGLPDKDLFLYGDDYEFSFRITQSGGRIFLCKDIIVKDLEESFYNKNKAWFRTRFAHATSGQSIYYMVRNNIKFEQNFVNNHILYSLNKRIYMFLLWLMMWITGDFQKYKVIRKAIRDSQ